MTDDTEIRIAEIDKNEREAVVVALRTAQG